MFLLALLAPNAYAAHPFITEDTGTQGKGKWQLEANIERSRDDDGMGGRITTTQPAATLSYGAVDNVDLQLTVPYARVKVPMGNVSGVLDTSLDVKWRFFEDGPLSLGLKPGITMPTGKDQDGLGTGKTTWGSLFILSYDREGWAFHSHAGYRRNRNVNGDRESLRHLSGMLWWKPTDKLKVGWDESRDTNPDPAASGSLRQRVLGVIWSVTPDFDLDAGIRRGKGDAIDRALLFGATLRW